MIQTDVSIGLQHSVDRTVLKSHLAKLNLAFGKFTARCASWTIPLPWWQCLDRKEIVLHSSSLNISPSISARQGRHGINQCSNSWYRSKMCKSVETSSTQCFCLVAPNRGVFQKPGSRKPRDQMNSAWPRWTSDGLAVWLNVSLRVTACITGLNPGTTSWTPSLGRYIISLNHGFDSESICPTRLVLAFFFLKLFTGRTDTSRRTGRILVWRPIYRQFILQIDHSMFDSWVLELADYQRLILQIWPTNHVRYINMSPTDH
jgi:hypothetical protein